MRPLLVLLAFVGAPVATSLSVWAAIQTGEPPWCEVLSGSLIRTTADQHKVNVAVSDAMRRAITLSDQPSEQQLVEAEYRESADAWFSTPDWTGAVEERASRLVRQQLVPAGGVLRVDVLHGAEMPSLVFVEHEESAVEVRVCRLIERELAAHGVPAR
ncbi:hypothetical protein [Botrimarina sp.]|uniref:hypothetical protein n=1 Tax=Botrimarina sp. TaxID=2795802 RepID=UPI0032EF15CB